MAEEVEEVEKDEREQAWLQSYIHSPEKQRNLYRKTLIIVVISQVFGGAGLAAGITIGALLAEDMLGTDHLAGLPAGLFTLGSAGAALLVGWLSQRFGRRSGLTAGFLAGGTGGLGVVVAALMNNVFLLFASLVVYGSGTATNLQARYAGTDLATPKQRATAVSIAMVSTTAGAVAGPNLVEVMGEFAASIGVPPLAGPFILAGAAFIMAGCVLFVFMRPDPFIVAKAIAKAQKTTARNSLNSLTDTTNKRGIMTGAFVMVMSQMIMLAIMTMTPVHMSAHGHGLRAVGMVIGIHIGAMFLPSLVTGMLVDKVGRTAMVIASQLTLLASGIYAATAPVDSVLALTVALALLGFGWNLGLISGTAIIVDATNPANRAKTQGNVDVFIALAGATGGALSGLVAGGFNFQVLSIGGGILALVVIPVIIWSQNIEKKQHNNK
ncbi:MFS transporter [Bacillus piscicola]|uniref:MFS transporter n=1 Tax=Bacillus piscicola TaxID=1632684 RepID=UPI001F09F991|nr:MFS transporter [Bacillus piscicola]